MRSAAVTWPLLVMPPGLMKCGKASLTLLRNGKILLKGTYIETHSEGVNRIKGGVVSIG